MAEDEVVTVQEGARRIGRTVDTLRRWRRDGVLAFEPKPDAQGRALVRMGALLAAAATHAKPTRPGASPGVVSSPRTAKGGELEAVKAHLEDAVKERDSLRAEAERLRFEVQHTRNELATTRERLIAVETELNGGVRGLLRRFRK